MGNVNWNQELQFFPPAQQKALRRLLMNTRRLVDQNLTVVAAPLNATTTVANLACPAAELREGSIMNLRLVASVSTVAGAAYNLTPLIALNGTTIWTDVISVGAVVDTDKVLLIDAQIWFQTPAVAVLSGFVMFAPDVVAADTGLGSTAVVAAVADEAKITPIYHTLSSQHLSRDQILTVTLAVPNTAGAGASAKLASLWVE